MSDRISQSQLEQLCVILNKQTGADTECWTRDDTGLHANIGTFYIDGAYGGVALYRMVTDGGGVTDVLSCGHTTKRDLYNRIRGLMVGMEIASEVWEAQLPTPV